MWSSAHALSDINSNSEDSRCDLRCCRCYNEGVPGHVRVYNGHRITISFYFRSCACTRAWPPIDQVQQQPRDLAECVNAFPHSSSPARGWPPRRPRRAPNVEWTCSRDFSKTGRKGVSPGVRFSLRRLHVGEVFPWYTCMPTLGARPHSACGVRRAHAPVMSTTSRLRRHIFALFFDMRNFSRWQPLRPPLRHGEGVRGRVFCSSIMQEPAARWRRDLTEARKPSYSPFYLWCPARRPRVPTAAAHQQGNRARRAGMKIKINSKRWLRFTCRCGGLTCARGAEYASAGAGGVRAPHCRLCARAQVARRRVLEVGGFRRLLRHLPHGVRRLLPGLLDARRRLPARCGRARAGPGAASVLNCGCVCVCVCVCSRLACSVGCVHARVPPALHREVGGRQGRRARRGGARHLPHVPRAVGLQGPVTLWPVPCPGGARAKVWCVCV